MHIFVIMHFMYFEKESLNLCFNQTIFRISNNLKYTHKQVTHQEHHKIYRGIEKSG